MPRHLLPGLLICALSLTACGGGGGSFGGEDPDIVEPPVGNPTNIAGVWDGTASFGDGTSGPVILFTTEDGSLRLIGLEFATQARGDIDLDAIDDLNGSAVFDANVTVFESQGFFFGNDIVTEDCSLDATVAEANSLSGSYICQSEQDKTGTFDTSYAALNATNASFEVISGIWVANDASLTLNVASNGDIIGAFTNNVGASCNLTGTANPITDENLYRLVFQLSNDASDGDCGPALAGTYDGLGTIEENANARDRFILQADNDELIFSYQLFSNK